MLTFPPPQQTWDTMVQNTHDISNTIWPPEMGTDLQFLDGFVDEDIVPSAVVGTNDLLPPMTSMETSSFPQTTQAQMNEDTTPFWL